MPSRTSAGVATAVLLPSAHAVRARPRALLDLDLPLRSSIEGDIGEATSGEPVPRRFDRERVRDGPLAPSVVMAEGLTVGRDAHHSALVRVGEQVLGALDERRARERAEAERDLVGEGALVEHDRDAAPIAARMAPPIGVPRVDGSIVDGFPHLVARSQRSHPDRLSGRQDRETHALLSEHLEHLVVHRRSRAATSPRHAARIDVRSRRGPTALAS